MRRSSPRPGEVARPSAVRRRLRVAGVVQGVGFRLFVQSLAGRHGVSGFVGNDTAGVVAELEGDPAAVDAVLAAIEAEPPPLATVERVEVIDIPPTGERGFTIADSRAGDGDAPT